MNLRQAAQQALEALENPNSGLVPHNGEWCSRQSIAITALKQALAEPQTTHWEGCEAVHPECRKPEQEPDGISWLKRDSGYFTAPTPRKPLTEGEIEALWQNTSPYYDHQDFARAIERHHGIGEQHE